MTVTTLATVKELRDQVRAARERFSADLTASACDDLIRARRRLRGLLYDLRSSRNASFLAHDIGQGEEIGGAA